MGLVAPSRGRGSKHDGNLRVAIDHVAPSRGRGSKQDIQCDQFCRPPSPFAGAWIETSSMPVLASSASSPLRGGVDRNVKPMRALVQQRQVAPSRGRGSKRPLSTRACPGSAVAPSRGRGSKLCFPVRLRRPRLVAPSRGRGSKHEGGKLRATCLGRPFAGRGSKRCPRRL